MDIKAIDHEQMAEPILMEGTYVLGAIPKSHFGDVEKLRQNTYKEELDQQVKD